MLYFLLAFFLLTTIKQWNSPLFHPQAAILGHLLEDSCCPFKYSPHLYRNTMTYTRYDDSFPHLDLIFHDLKIEVGIRPITLVVRPITLVVRLIMLVV